MQRLRTPGGLFLPLGWLLGVFGAVATVQAAEYKVIIKDFAFSPASLTIQAGDTVVFVNEDQFPHTATKEETFDTDELETEHTRRITFTKAGQYTYGCSIHPSMEGTITVR